MHGPVGLPANAENLFLLRCQSLPGGNQGKGKLGCWVSPEIADAGGPFVGIRHKPVHWNGSGFQRLFSEVPVLAKETIEGAGVEKNGKVFIASLRACAMGVLGEAGPGSAGANPVGHAVGRQRIVVPGELAFSCRNSSDLSSLIMSQPAIPQSALRNPAFIHAEIAGDSLIVLRGCPGQMIGGSAFLMGFHDKRQGLIGFRF
jgi:hypothetical protein